MMIVSDLHLEKGSSLAARGHLVPPYDTAATLAALRRAIEHHRPRLVIALGDSFHDSRGPERMAPDDRRALAGLQAGRTWVWVAGNHDGNLCRSLSGDHAETFEDSGVVFRHEPTTKPDLPEVAGHFHPSARIRALGRTIRRKCFVSGSNRLVLPAFGAFTGGLNIRDAAFSGLFGSDCLVHMLGSNRVYTVARHQCLPD